MRLGVVYHARCTSVTWVFLLLFEASSSALQDTFSVEYACRVDVQGLCFPGDKAD